MRKPSKPVLIAALLLGAAALVFIGGTGPQMPKAMVDVLWGFFPVACAVALVFLAVAIASSMPTKWVVRGLFLVWLGWASSIVFWPVFASARVAKRSVACQTNLKNLSTNMHIYIASNDDVFPPADRWSTLIGHGEPPKCPFAQSPYSYAMNRNLSKVSATEIAEPGRTVLIFEMDAQTPNASGTEADVVDRHGRRPKAVMTDGHVGTSRSARWQP